MREIAVLRLNHRVARDERVSTHVALVARAFGAKFLAYTGEKDSSLEKSIENVVNNWGGSFFISFVRSGISFLKELKNKSYKIVHLTMYGIPLPEKIDEIKKYEKIVIVVGGEKVQREFYEIADFNISVTLQPHSEVSALAIILDRLFEGKELEREFDKNFDGKIKIIPQDKGKRIIKK